MTCPNCNQLYRGHVAIDLSDLFVEFTEKKYPDCGWRRLSAYCAYHLVLNRTTATNAIPEMDVTERIKTTREKCISILDPFWAKNRSPMLSHEEWATVSVSSDVYSALGEGELIDPNMTEEGAKRGIKYLERARGILKKYRFDLMDQAGALKLDADIARHKATCFSKYGKCKEFGGEEIREDSINKHRALFKMHENTDPFKHIVTGRLYAQALLDGYHSIEAIRVLQKLHPRSQQVHGPEHDMTRFIQHLIKKTIGAVRFATRDGTFQAVRYEGDKCFVRGPIGTSEDLFSVNADTPLPSLGTPVVCQGFKNAPELNGKIGDVRSYDSNTQMFCVYFDDKRIAPKRVKNSNLQILFDIPEKSS